MATSDIKKGPLYVDSTNNRVGIGLTSAEATLDVLGNSDVTAALKIGPNANFGHHFYDSSTNGDLVIKREVSGVQTETMRLARSGGYVGIGGSPYQKLDVYGGNIAVSSADTYQTSVNIDNTDTGGRHWGLHSTGSNNTAGEFRIYDYDANVERMRIDGSGRVTMPYQPSFWAFLNGNWGSWTPNNQTQVVPFDQAYHNIGNHYNGSTGLFTCPVAGNYVFTGGTYVGGSSVEQLWLVKNGVRQPSFAFPNAGSTGDRAVGTYLMRCSANDTIGLCPYGSPSTTSTVFANFYHTFFIGALLG